MKGCGGLYSGDTDSLLSQEWIADLPDGDESDSEAATQWKKFADLIDKPFDEWYSEHCQ
jgi:hypothetical protein